MLQALVLVVIQNKFDYATAASLNKSKKEGKYQESIQSSTTPDPGLTYIKRVYPRAGTFLPQGHNFEQIWLTR